MASHSSVPNDMHLQLNTSYPDPIGFANVTSFYGPGTWAGWYLTMCASWYSLAGLNWASLDLVRHLVSLRNVREAGDDAWTKQAASIGAALTVTIWGHAHALWQLVWTFFWEPSWEEVDWRKVQHRLTLLVGSAFPATALVASSWMMKRDAELSSHVPALYYRGMSTQGPSGLSFDAAQDPSPIGVDHEYTLHAPGVSGVGSLFLDLFLLYHVFRLTFVVSVLRRLLGHMRLPVWLPCRGILAMTPGFSHIGGPTLWLLVGILCSLLPSMALISPALFEYLLEGYFQFGYIETSVIQSCFFMPCAPQSIKEMDQAFALFAGIFSFIIVEVVVPYARRRRQERRERQLFEQEVGQRIEMGTMGRLPSDGV